MKDIKSLYKSEIDTQAKRGGAAADGKEVRSQLKRTYVTIGSGETQKTVSEAQTQFVIQGSSVQTNQ